MTELEFLKHLREEKTKAQATRSMYIDKKLAYATALLGVGSLGINLGPLGAMGPINLSLLLYLVPWVALAFDLYILGEDYSVKRIGVFLAQRSTDSTEQAWESWIARHRDPFAPFAMPTLTTLLLAGAAVMLWVGGVAIGAGFWLWLGITLGVIWGLFAVYRRLRMQTGRRAEAVRGVAETKSPLAALMDTAKRAGYILNQATYRKARALFLACADNPALLRATQHAAPEYGKPEFLLSVDAKGQPVYVDATTIQDFETLVAQHPNFALWFQLAPVATGERPVLLIARWLCHLVGFRHRAVHLFLDHPSIFGYTLVQVRSTNKAEAPGSFDLPVAGHITGLTDVEAALASELQEELGLNQDAVADLRLLGEYEYAAPLTASLQNREWRSVFGGRLQVKALAGIHFADGEAAALAVFSVIELQTFVETCPERVASGLAHSFRVYMQERKADDYLH